VIYHRRITAPQIEMNVNKTHDVELRRQLEEPLRLLASITTMPWFRATAAWPMPKVTDFVSVRAAAQHTYVGQLGEREYDDKFGILLSPGLLRLDLDRLRSQCELRGCPLSVAFIDIDDFKKYNTKYGEPAVDRGILPRFMMALEAHMFYRGLAYRHGGDEYVAILPNMTHLEGANTLSQFQIKLKSIAYPEIASGDPKPTVSIGICEINEDSMLTDMEAEERSARAKQHAKNQGKNCIASYKSLSLYSDEDLFVVDYSSG
jgi:diguanylate cyclase (GGDEF)-like protein